MNNLTTGKIWLARGMAAAVVVVLAAATVLQVQAAGPRGHGGAAGGHEARGVLLTGVASPAALAAQLQGLPAHLDAAVGLSSAQKAQTMERIAQASGELAALQQLYQERNGQMLTLLTQQNIDEQAVESLRREQAAGGEQGSRCVTQLMVDLARLLTSQQRQHFAGPAASHGHG